MAPRHFVRITETLNSMSLKKEWKAKVPLHKLKLGRTLVSDERVYT